MIVITPVQSERIGAEIFEQIVALDDLAERFAPPWGAAARARMKRLLRERLCTLMPGPAQ